MLLPLDWRLDWQKDETENVGSQFHGMIVQECAIISYHKAYVTSQMLPMD
jgi:hypothetical protein